jgi:hypothetical protein
MSDAMDVFGFDTEPAKSNVEETKSTVGPSR